MIFPYYVGDRGRRLNSSWPLLIIIAANIANYTYLTDLNTRNPKLVENLYLWVGNEGNSVAHLVLATFFHGDIFHLLFNMWFLWLFALPLVNGLRARHFFFLYFMAGIAGTFLQDQLTDGGSIGASGAISGMMGFFMVHFMTTRVWCLLVVVPISLPAWLLVGVFIANDILGAVSDDEFVGYWAHIGGTAIGLMMGLAVLWHDNRLNKRVVRSGRA